MIATMLRTNNIAPSQRAKQKSIFRADWGDQSSSVSSLAGHMSRWSHVTFVTCHAGYMSRKSHVTGHVGLVTCHTGHGKFSKNTIGDTTSGPLADSKHQFPVITVMLRGIK
jgi:hypothetical protein